MSTSSSIVPSPSTPTPSPKSRIVQSPSTIPFSSSHTTTSSYPHFSQFKASHLLSKAYLNHHINNNSSINSANSHLQTHLNSKLLNSNPKESKDSNSAESSGVSSSSSSSSSSPTASNKTTQAVVHHQRVVDPDEKPINPFTISGFFYKTLIVIISILPLVFVENLLTLFAWIQIELLKAKKGSVDNNRASLKKKRKAKKKKSKALNTNNTLVSSTIHKVPSSSNFKHIRRLSYSGSGLPHYKSHLIGHSNLNPNKNNNNNNNNNNNTNNNNHETPSLPPTTVPDNIPITTTPTIKLTPPIESIKSECQQQQPTIVEELDTSSSTSRVNEKPIHLHHGDHEESSDTQVPSSITELEEEDDIHHSEVSSDADHADHHHHHLDGDDKHLDWTNQLNPNDIDASRLMVSSISNDHLHHQLHPIMSMMKGHANHLINEERSLIQGRQRADSISILPSLEEKLPTFSEIRRVNSEQALHQTSEESLLWEANQQSRKEFEEFLKSVKDIKDVHNWLRNFSNSASKKIAIVKISRRILDTPHGVESAAQSLSFMYKFGIYPIVIHGGLNDISKLPISEVVEERYNRSCLLKEAIKKNGVGCTILPPSICKIEPFVSRRTNNSNSNSDDNNDSLSEEEQEFGQSDILPSGGLTMKIDSFDYDIITTALDKGKIPIWDSVAETIDQIEIPINSDITTFELAKRIEPYKIIFACNDGGILDSDHKAIPVVYMSNDYKALIQAEHTTDRRRVQLKQMKRIVDHLPSSTTVVVTSIESLTHQLLFPRLANGTVIKKREDNKVHIYDADNYKSIDIERLRELIQNSFGKLLSQDYFDYLKDSLYRLYLCENSDGEYTGCAIVTFKSPDYIPYLCKFCVKKSAQGLGLGDLIWRVLQRDNEKLYWRSRNNNPLNPWYFQRCQGSFRADEAFTIFWYGDDKFEDGSFLIEEALRKPISILPNPVA
ncbi:hypothetical protein CYY_004143 [Polysphondylium violaceum]|uniref:Acetylglutamate kinase n=1 Tax=Polysphondylium violaceum TaxID=133409 RepID=A0A8J4Q5Y5_9MYCE|nr:hypothetical protein CYY_004143 [Polysphondylium violaceum]